MTALGVKPAPVQTGPAAAGRSEWLALAVTCLVVVLISVDGTVLNVALPALVKALHPSPSGLQWIADSYTLTNAVLLLFCGTLGDRFGRRRIFMIGLAVFGVGSLACALAPSTGLLIAARATLGLGAAFLMPATLSIIVATFSVEQRGQAIGIWAGAGGIGAAAGPILGGYLLQHFWWGSVFLINVPIVVVALVGAALVVPESKARTARTLDPVGAVLCCAGVAAVTYALIDAPNAHFLSATVLGLVAASIGLLALFRARDKRRADPLFDLALFSNPTFSSALGAVTATFFALFAVSYLLSQYLQFVQGVDSYGVGLRFIPLALSSLIASNLAARLALRFGLRRIMLTGLAVVVAGLVTFATVTATSGYLRVGVAFSLIGVGSSLAIAPASNAIMGTLPADKVGAGAGLRGMVQWLGGSFGVAIGGSLVSSRYRSHLGPTLARLPAGVRPAVNDQIGSAVGAVSRLPADLAARTLASAREAFVSGLRLSAVVSAVVLTLATLAAAAYIPRKVNLDALEHTTVSEPL